MGLITVKMWEMPVLINCFSIAILIILYLDNQNRHLENKSQKYFFFQHMVVVNFLLLVLDGVTWLVSNTTNPTLRIVNISVTTIYYMLTPFPSYFFVNFADVVLNIGTDMRKKMRRIYAIPVALNLVLSLVSPFTGWLFWIDEANVYHRGSLLAVSFILSLVLLFFTLAKVLLRYKAAHKRNGVIAKNVKEYKWILQYTLVPILGGLVQANFYNVTYVWNFTAIGLLILYINYQNAEITTDTLTGLYNRRQSIALFDQFVREQAREKSSIAVIMIDINNFKHINDHYGHSLGDEAIVAVARVLEAEFQWDDFICRFGGDEFVIITKHGNPKTLDEILQSVNENLQAQHREAIFVFELSVSAGYARYSRKNRTLDSLIRQADDMMFEQKAKLLRRASDRQVHASKP